GEETDLPSWDHAVNPEPTVLGDLPNGKVDPDVVAEELARVVAAQEIAGRWLAFVVQHSSSDDRALLQAYRDGHRLVTLELDNRPEVLAAVTEEEPPRLLRIDTGDAKLRGRQVASVDPIAYRAIDTAARQGLAVGAHDGAGHRPAGVKNKV